MKRFLILPLIFYLIFTTACLKKKTKDAYAEPKDRSVVMFVGLDEAAMNMDVICYVSFDSKSNEVAFVQLPRDTYFNFGSTQNKVNQLYAFYRKSEDPSIALKHATDEISTALGVSISGYVAITTRGLVSAIDAVGGVDIEVKNDGVFTDEFGKNPLRLRAGKNHLEGASAVQFIRYRQGYLTGDLGRLDAQKLFFRAALEKITERPSLDRMLNAYFGAKDEIETDMDLFDVLRMSGAGLKQLSEAKVSYITMPGEAIISESGISYFSLTRETAKAVCEKYLFSNGFAFDKSERFLKKNELGFSNIYYDKNNMYRVYDNDTLTDITVPKKQ